MKLSVLLTLDGLSQEQGLIEGISKSTGTFEVCAEVGHDSCIRLRLSVGPSLVEAGRKGYRDDVVIGSDERCFVEKDERSSIPIDVVRQRDELGFVGHVSSIRSGMRIAAMPQVQDYGIVRSQPPIQGVSQTETTRVYQDGTSRSAQRRF